MCPVKILSVNAIDLPHKPGDWPLVLEQADNNDSAPDSTLQSALSTGKMQAQ